MSGWGPAVALRAKRRAAGLTQRQLGEAVGLDHTYVSRIEAGACNPSRQTAARIAAAIGETLPPPPPVNLPAGWVAITVEEYARLLALDESVP